LNVTHHLLVYAVDVNVLVKAYAVL